jgi:uncharacterized protein YkwD
MAATALEQLQLELINEARLNPMASAARYIVTYSPLVSNQTNIQNNFQHWGVNGSALLSAFQALQPVQPLAWNESLASAARSHDNAMIAANLQTHQAPGEAAPDQRMVNAGYAASGTFAWAENVAAQGQDALHILASFMVDWGPGGMQNPPGHRNNIMSTTYREVGVGIVAAATTNVGPQAVTEDFGRRSTSGVFILGVAYTDTDNNKFYSAGEGLGTLVVTAPGASAVTSATTGGYVINTATVGAQHITFSGAGLSGTVDFLTTLSNGQNLKIDIVGGNTLLTSVSGTVTGAISLIKGLGIIGLALTGDSHSQSFMGTIGNDTFTSGGGTDTVIYAGNRSAYTINASGGNFTVTGAEGTDLLSGITFVQFANDTVSLSPSTTHAIAHDFNGDTTSDVLWRNNSSGHVGIWEMHNNVQTWHDLGGSGVDHKVVGSGQFNSDTTSDLLWRNDSTGHVGIWEMHNNVQTWRDLGGSGVDHKVVGVGLFNSDTTSDILWRNDSTGHVGIWEMHNNVQTWRDLGGSGVDHKVVGVGDFNGDGTSDILWRNDSSGHVGIWEMHNNVQTWRDLGGSGVDHKVVGIGDFNGDNTSDILWRNNSNGHVGIWEMHNNVQTWRDLGGSGVDHKVVGVGYYNADSTSDIFWRNDSTGHVGIWEMHNNVPTWRDLGGSGVDHAFIV